MKVAGGSDVIVLEECELVNNEIAFETQRGNLTSTATDWGTGPTANDTDLLWETNSGEAPTDLDGVETFTCDEIACL